MTTDPQQFPVSMRFLHWLMAAMVLTMLGIGVAMVASLADYHRLVSIHRPVGILILILVVIRFVNRRFSTLPPFPATMSSQERFIAHASEMLLYTLLFVQPLVGWGMLSAARYPIVLYGPLHLFPILPHSVMLYAALRKAHTVLAYLLFLSFIAHFGAVLFHTLILRASEFSAIRHSTRCRRQSRIKALRRRGAGPCRHNETRATKACEVDKTESRGLAQSLHHVALQGLRSN
jgi:cytochrome b561